MYCHRDPHARDPSQRLRPTQAKKKILKQIPNDALQGITGAAFDTRLTDEEIEVTAVIAFFVRINRYAA